MLQVTIPAEELYDETKNEFITQREQKLTLEHSLLSLSKWESKMHKPFLTMEPKTIPEVVEYIRCMTLTQNVDPLVYNRINNNVISQVEAYMQNSMTATWFAETKKTTRNREVITSELIYYWMIALGIPFECQKWHLNRLLTLIRVCNEKNAQPKKMSKRELASRNRALNAARRARLKSKG